MVNDFHMELAWPPGATILGCSVPPASSWFCDVEPTSASWWTFTNPVQPGDPLPEFDLVIQGAANETVCLWVSFTLDGCTVWNEMVYFPPCQPVSTEESSWGNIKMMFR